MPGHKRQSSRSFVVLVRASLSIEGARVVPSRTTTGAGALVRWPSCGTIHLHPVVFFSVFLYCFSMTNLVPKAHPFPFLFASGLLYPQQRLIFMVYIPAVSILGIWCSQPLAAFACIP
ncbi:T. brucei spp.-specific protein [Trypanosoma brucei gambiense DAL972]|uniref:T. brucei spp.-specific protein n=1 Tax=Trypanosoma brucei gambiense (strain MHOM/CI/86/DAL972) TaxID=679716 RepID=D0AAD7_TRYB9|nr:T. brucei spp.-specific protein [Trypanosoma brucei gambiense DAL972]CBH18638.1 T. brucei spp.-specific protein [Trypanosoma brucei gambiense DAL972]|eukprot:XP_011780902.1 T. brucei spp.-specific protein [Trypanosoma brucei gambiense DAL972]